MSDHTSGRWLEQALLFTIVAHGSAMLAMALLLLPGMPGGGAATDLIRIQYIAEHPWLWRLGWLPWHLTALSDVLLALALLRTTWIPRLPALLVLGVTLVAVWFEQPAEIRWETEGVALAQAALQNGDLTAYMHFENQIFVRLAAWAPIAYTTAALGWTYCFAAAGIWNRRLTWLSIPTWSILMAVSVAPLLPENLHPGDALIATGNALGFVFLITWLWGVTELVFRRVRPLAGHGRMAAWIHPQAGWIGRAVTLCANSHVARGLGEWLPMLAYLSDIRSVIYINYLVEAERLLPLVPEGLTLQRLGPENRYAMFSHLTYRHGHFGPRLLGGLRRLLPSPIQSNWRIYVCDSQSGRAGVYFVSTAISMTLHAVMARLLSEGAPMHLLQHAEVLDLPDGMVQICLDPGAGSAPDLQARLTPAREPVLPAPWNLCFADYRAFLSYCVPQDRAISTQPWYQRITRQEIRLGIPLDTCQPMTGHVASQAAQAIIGAAEPICFRVPEVAFVLETQEFDVCVD